MDDKEKGFDPADFKDDDSLFADDIPLDAPSDFVDETHEEAPRAEKEDMFLPSEEEKRQLPAEENEMNDTEKNDVDKDTPVVDESAPAPDAEEMNEALKPKLKETSVKKKKRIIIAVVAAVLVVAITLGIALPIYFVNKDKIFVKSAEDFANYNSGTYFVLDKDVTVEGDLTIDRLYNIDLNGHTLVVNGTLRIEAGTEGTLYIGTKKGKEYISKGLLQANIVEISTKEADVNLTASVTVNTMTVTAKSFTLSSSAQANGTFTVNAPKADINGSIAFGEGENAKFAVNNCAELNVNANVSSAVEICYSTLNLAKSATIGSLSLDPASRASIYGKVSERISTLDTSAVALPAEQEAAALSDSTAANNIVVLLGTDYACPLVSDVNTVAFEIRTDYEIEVRNCATVKRIFRLSAPIDVNIDERSDGSLVAVASDVVNAQGYAFRIDGGDWVNTDGKEYSITSQLTSQTGTHRIEVYARGNYSYSDPFNLGENAVLYLDGASTACEYVYQIQLATPSNLNVTKIVEEGVVSYKLTFDKVAFATRYEYYVNGTKYEFTPEGDDALVTIDITDKLSSAGAYAIRVIAAADSADILTSKPAMTSAIKDEKLATPSLSAIQQENGDVVLTIKTTEGVSTTFLITYTETLPDNTQKSVTLITSKSEITLTGLNANDIITVVAQSSGYYTQSDVSAAAVTPYTPAAQS